MEPQISPLAKRLAEENSIDWRVIPGTGPDNRVIERDILTYLARIMSGEIDPPALPDASEPPASGPSAPDLAQVGNFAAASAGMAKEGIDLGSLIAPPATVPAAPNPGLSNLDSSSADHGSALEAPRLALEEAPAYDFGTPTPAASAPLSFSAPSTALEELTLEPAPSAATSFEAFNPAPEPVLEVAPASVVTPATSAEVEFDFDLDDLEEPEAATLAPAMPEDLVLTVDTGVGQAENFLPNPEPLRPSEDFAVGDISGEPVLEVEEAHPPVFVAPKPEPQEPTFVAALEEPAHEAPAVTFAAPASEPVQAARQADAFEPVALEPVAAEPVHAEPASAALELDDDFEMDLTDPEPVAFTAPTEFATPSFEAVAPAEVAPTEPALEPTPTFASLAELEPVHDAAPVAPLETPAPFEPTPEPAHEPAPEALPAFVAPAVAAVGTAAAFAATQPAHEEVAVPPAPASSPVAAGFYQGFAVRRHFDASALGKIQSELSGAMNNRDVPLGVFLGRAAQRHLHALGTTDVVTLARLTDTVEPLNTPGLHHSFLEAVQSVARATPAGSAYGLVVLDASHLGVDDLVLPGAQPVLSMNVNGDHGYLSLAGNLPADKAAAFLGRVAGALEVPVSLVI